MQSVLGLGHCILRDSLADPVERIAHDRPSFRDSRVESPAYTLRLAYLLLRASRWVPLCWMARLVHAVGVRAPRQRRTVSEIGRTLFEVERVVGLEDCYPRALMTVYLCARARRPCDLVVGCLAPTRLMHTWCSCLGVLPYEPLPEHYMYQPLYVRSFDAQC